MNLMTKDDFPVEQKCEWWDGGAGGQRRRGGSEDGGEVTHRLNGSQGQQSFSSSRYRWSLWGGVGGGRGREGGAGEESIKGEGEGL